MKVFSLKDCSYLLLIYVLTLYHSCKCFFVESCYDFCLNLKRFYAALLMEIFMISTVTVSLHRLSNSLMHDFLTHRKVSHPKLVRLFGVCTQQSPMYLVFEFLENGCLTEFLRSRKGCVSQETLLGMCTDVSEAMAYLESSNYIHRDLVKRDLFPVIVL